MNTAVTIAIDSQLAQVTLIHACITGLTQQCGLDEMISYQIQTCVAEAVNNAIIHAYNEEPGHPVWLVWRQELRQIVIEVRDEGITMEEEPDADLPDLEYESGRGWFIMKNWMDRVDYSRNQQGQNVLTMVKDLTTLL